MQNKIYRVYGKGGGEAEMKNTPTTNMRKPGPRENRHSRLGRSLTELGRRFGVVKRQTL